MRRMTTAITSAVLTDRTITDRTGLIKLSLSQVASRVTMEPQPAFDKFPFSSQAQVALLMQNGVLQGLEESVPEEDISCRDRPLKAIDADETIFKNGLSFRRPAIKGLNVDKYYQWHDTPCCLDVVPPVDLEMKSLCCKDVKPVLTLQHLTLLTLQRPASCSGPSGSSLSE